MSSAAGSEDEPKPAIEVLSRLVMVAESSSAAPSDYSNFVRNLQQKHDVADSRREASKQQARAQAAVAAPLPQVEEAEDVLRQVEEAKREEEEDYAEDEESEDEDDDSEEEGEDQEEGTRAWGEQEEQEEKDEPYFHTSHEEDTEGFVFVEATANLSASQGGRSTEEQQAEEALASEMGWSTDDGPPLRRAPEPAAESAAAPARRVTAGGGAAAKLRQNLAAEKALKSAEVFQKGERLPGCLSPARLSCSHDGKVPDGLGMLQRARWTWRSCRSGTCFRSGQPVKDRAYPEFSNQILGT